MGYLLQHIQIRTYILLRDLKRMIEILESHPMFADLIRLGKEFPDNNERPNLEVSVDGRCRFYSEEFT